MLVLDINNFIKSEEKLLSFSYDVDLSEYDIAFKNVHIEGSIKNTVKVFLFTAEIEAVYETVCNRCSKIVFLKTKAPIKTDITIQSSKDDSVIIENGRINIEKTCYDALILALPIKILCSENCRGLCQFCGNDLNIKECDCKKI